MGGGAPGNTGDGLRPHPLAPRRLELVCFREHQLVVHRRLVEAWQSLIRDYLRGRASLRRVFVLIDARHGVTKTDEAMLDLLDEAAVNYQLVLTKADKLKPPGRERVRAETIARIAKRPAAHPEVHLTSSVTGAGLAELRAEIVQLLEG